MLTPLEAWPCLPSHQLQCWGAGSGCQVGGGFRAVQHIIGSSGPTVIGKTADMISQQHSKLNGRFLSETQVAGDAHLHPGVRCLGTTGIGTTAEEEWACCLNN